MSYLSKLAASFGLTLFLAGTLLAEHVKAGHDHHANSSQFKTYSWEKVQTEDPCLVDPVKGAVNSALASKGWTEVPSGGGVEVFVRAGKIQKTTERTAIHSPA
jgi:hypothetical protein